MPAAVLSHISYVKCSKFRFSKQVIVVSIAIKDGITAINGLIAIDKWNSKLAAEILIFQIKQSPPDI